MAVLEETPLRAARKRAGLTLNEVATAVGVTLSHYASIERMVAGASAELAEKLSKFFAGEVTELQILYPERFIKKQKSGGR